MLQACCIEVVGLPPHRASAVPSCDQLELGSDGSPSCGIHLLPVQHKSIMAVSPGPGFLTHRH